ncbi:hypothetical protein C3L33_05081, partial [Rhododendron williamsianum]
MEFKNSTFIKLLIVQCLSVFGLAQNFDFFYFVQQVSDLISSLQKSWPTLACPSGNGLSFWSHEWAKHGTCSEAVLDQHGYFKSALKLKAQIDLLQILLGAGINPDGGSYSISSIQNAVRNAIGSTPGIECNVDAS